MAETSVRLGVGERRVYQLIEKRLLPAIRLGRSVRVPWAAWDDWLDDQGRRALAAIEEGVEERAAPKVCPAPKDGSTIRDPDWERPEGPAFPPREAAREKAAREPGHHAPSGTAPSP